MNATHPPRRFEVRNRGATKGRSALGAGRGRTSRAIPRAPQMGGGRWSSIDVGVGRGKRCLQEKICEWITSKQEPTEPLWTLFWMSCFHLMTLCVNSFLTVLDPKQDFHHPPFPSCYHPHAKKKKIQKNIWVHRIVTDSTLNSPRTPPAIDATEIHRVVTCCRSSSRYRSRLEEQKSPCH